MGVEGTVALRGTRAIWKHAADEIRTNPQRPLEPSSGHCHRHVIAIVGERKTENLQGPTFGSNMQVPTLPQVKLLEH